MESTTAPAVAPTATMPTPAAMPTALPAGSHREGLTPHEAEVMAGWVKEDLAKGKVTPEQASANFDQLKATPDQRAPDTRSADEKELDALFPGAEPGEYLIKYDHLPIGKPIPEELKAFDTAARTWLSESGVPREIGNSFVTNVDRAGKELSAMNPAQRDRYADEQYTILERTYGNNLESKLKRAGAMVQQLEKKRPGLNALLKSGIGDDARVASLLIQQSERYWARKGR